MSEKQPVWKDDILYVPGVCGEGYYARYTLPHMLLLVLGMSKDEWKRMTGLDKYKVIE